jgi:uracil-DNA glycosylase
MKKVKIEGSYKFPFAQYFGLTWLGVLSKLICSNYMFNLLVWLEEMANLNQYFDINTSLFYPVRQHLFKNFKTCSFTNLKVVIVGDEPYRSSKATGIPFANTFSSGSNLSPELTKIKECVKRTLYKDKHHYFFDETLQRWGREGVLLLNSTSTADPTTKHAHSVYWKKFTREVIKAINNNKDEIIFCFWGNNAAEFADYVDNNKHTLLFYQHPEIAVEDKHIWNCPHFKTINKILEKRKKSGKTRSEPIHW